MGAGGYLALAGAAGFAQALALFPARGSVRPSRRGRGSVLAGPLARIGELVPVREWRRREEVARRKAECLRQLPLMLDILTLGLSAGLSFDASVELYCAQAEGGLADALREAMLSWRMGARTRDQALRRLADELEVPALRGFAAAVSQALRFGAPLAETLERQAGAIREEQRSRISEEIEKVPVKMLIPMGTLLVPAMLLAILGPLLGSMPIGI